MKRNFRILAALVPILALAAYLRLANHTDNPGWYTDEGTHLAIAGQLLRGRIQYLAVNQSTLLFARLPLFEVLLAGLLRFGGEGMGTLRAFTGALGVASVGLLYLVIRQMSRDTALALLAALVLAIYPQAVLYSRFGFSYNLLTPLVLLACLGLWEYLGTIQRRWLALAALAVGVGAVSDLLMLAFTVPLLIVILWRRWRDIVWAALLAGLPFGVYAALSLAAAPQAFLFDLRFTFLRLNTLSPAQQLATLADNYTTLLTQDAWMAAALVGLFMLRPPRLLRLSLLMLLLPLVLLGRMVALYSLSAYYLILLLPFVALGVAALIRYGTPYVWRVVNDGLSSLLARLYQRVGAGLAPAQPSIGAALVVGVIVATPFVISTTRTVANVQSGFQTSIDDFLVNPDDAREAAAFVNAHTRADELVIASPALAWLFRADAADFQMAAAAAGQSTVHVPDDLPSNRFAFDPRVPRARFVVVDNLWRNWAAVDIPAAAEMLRQVQAWPLVLRAGEIEVYRNPAFLQ